VTKATPQTRTLHRALTICGSIASLAKSLHMTIGSLQELLDGTTVPTAEAYIAAIDIVATNDCKPSPYANRLGG